MKIEQLREHLSLKQGTEKEIIHKTKNENQKTENFNQTDQENEEMTCQH